MYQEDYIDEMLHLTADIAEELLAVKDTGCRLANETAEKIARLAELAVSVRLDDETDPVEEPQIIDPVIPPVAEASQVACVPESSGESVNDPADTFPYQNEPVEDISEVVTSDVVEESDNAETAAEESVSETISEEIMSETDECENRTGSLPASVILQEEQDKQEIADAAIQEEEDDADMYQDARTVSRIPLFTARELRNAFTLNDVFLFQRTLFHGSSVEFKNALEEITSFTNVHELEDYLASTHGVDVEMPEAKEFIAIVSNFLHG